VVVEINQAALKGFSRCEQLIFAPGHRRNRPGDIFFHRVSGHQKSANYVGRRVPVRLVPVTASFGVQHLGERWRERQCVHNSVATADGSHDVVNLSEMASMVAVFAHQEENTLALGWFFFEQSNRKLYGVLNGRSVIAWLQPLEVFVNGRFIVAVLLGPTGP
jgi:hypothetical protein